MKYLISIIIPVFNVEKYVKKCLESISKQHANDIEVICIDDGSTDNSGLICDEYGKKDNRFKIIHKKNEGVSSARNLGLNLAKGKYIFWIDSDDWIENNSIDKIKRTIEKTNADIILFDFYSVKESGIKSDCIFEKSKMLSKNEILTEVAQDSFRSFLWRTIAKKDLYKNICFPKGIQMMEDFSIYHILFHKANTFFYIKKPLYYYRLVNNSLSQKKKNIELIYNISLQREEFFRKNYPEIGEKYRLVPLLSASCAILEIYKLNNETYGNPKYLIKKYLYFLLTRNYLSMNKKIQFLVILISGKLLNKIRKIYMKLTKK